LTGRRIRGIALTAALLATFALALVPAAVAGKPGGSGSTSGSSFSLALMDGATQAAHNGRITFNVSTTATDRPFVGLRCWQGSNWVFDAYVGYFPSYMFEPWFVLDGPYWADGVAASCTARLFYFDRRGREKVLGTMSFPVAP
jgi:hypothetical protein